MASTTIDYSEVTEAVGNRISREAIEMMWTRYDFAARYCEGKDVLEAGCGAGQGLGLLAKSASFLVGSDYTESLVRSASNHYRGRVPVMRADAQELPFRDDSFDTVIFFEAVYYLQNVKAFLTECKRVLRPGGILVLCSANPERPDFNPSPHSVQYYSASELFRILTHEGFEAEIFAAYPLASQSLKSGVITLIKRVAVGLRLVPKSMKGKELLKRIFLGRLEEMPQEMVHRPGECSVPTQVSLAGALPGYKVIYSVGHIK